MEDWIAGQIKSIKNGRTELIFNRDGAITLDEVRQISELLKSDRTIRRLTLADSQMTDEMAAVLAEGIKENTTLDHLSIKGNPLTDDGIAPLMDSLTDHPAITSIDMSRNQFGAKATRAIGLLYSRNPSLKQLQMEESTVQAGAWQPFGDMLKQSKLAVIGFNKCGIGNADALILAEGLRHNRNVSKIYLQDNAYDDNTKQILTEAVHASGNKNVGTYGGLDTDRLKSLGLRNTTWTARLRKTLINTEHLIAMNTADLYAIEERYNIISNGAAPRIRERYRSFLEQLPPVSSEQFDTPESLFEVNEIGFTPLDNPKIWEHFPQICAKLAERGTPLTRDMLNQPNRDHESYLYTALCNGPVGPIMRGLNASGIRLQTSALLKRDGTASDLLDGIVENGDANELFTAANWQGARPRDVTAVMHALPEKANVSNQHSLLASLSRRQISVAR